MLIFKHKLKKCPIMPFCLCCGASWGVLDLPLAHYRTLNAAVFALPAQKQHCGCAAVEAVFCFGQFAVEAQEK